ncbi:haloacid dehalogenase, partial [Pseudomonas sp. CCI3.1]|nr:haloacid dehalogenase [Pseudomonas sp. CCI3.1]
WMEHLPQRYAELHGVSRAMAELEMAPLFEKNAGTLNWYCLDFWSAELKLYFMYLILDSAKLFCLCADSDSFFLSLYEAVYLEII